jgi:endonuclease YncB( thermonuclease family)
MASLCGCTPAAALPPAEPISGCVVVDGDTLRCGEERIRLLAIDAPEKPGNCREGRQCAPGDPFASEQTLRAAAKPTMTIRRIGTDRFGRTLALIDAQGRDLSCHQLASRAAIYNPRWDDGGFVMAICPEAAARQTLSR